MLNIPLFPWKRRSAKSFKYTPFFAEFRTLMRVMYHIEWGGRDNHQKHACLRWVLVSLRALNYRALVHTLNSVLSLWFLSSPIIYFPMTSWPNVAQRWPKSRYLHFWRGNGYTVYVPIDAHCASTDLRVCVYLLRQFFFIFFFKLLLFFLLAQSQQ